MKVEKVVENLVSFEGIRLIFVFRLRDSTSVEVIIVYFS